jgi:hypothetical protein
VRGAKSKTGTKKKVMQFVRAPSYSYSTGLTLDLIDSANALLIAAAAESSQEIDQGRVAGASRFAPGAVLLSVAAFELFLNYLIVGDLTRSDAEIQLALDRKPTGKIDYLTAVFGTTCSSRADLEIVIEVRNEIAHHFPRPGNASENLPAWYETVERRGMLITTGRTDGDWPSTVKKSRGATFRKSASWAISCARPRARSVRSPSAKACSRQAIRRNKMFPVPGSRFFLKHLSKLLSQACQARPTQLLNFHQYRFVHRCLPLCDRQPQSHERSLPLHKQVQISRKGLGEKQTPPDESGGVKGRR